MSGFGFGGGSPRAAAPLISAMRCVGAAGGSCPARRRGRQPAPGTSRPRLATCLQARRSPRRAASRPAPRVVAREIASSSPNWIGWPATLQRHPRDEERDDAQEHEQPHRADVAHAPAGEVFAAQVRGLGEQRPQRAEHACVDVEHGVQEVADDAGEMPHQPGHRLAAAVAVRAEQRRAAVLAGGAWRTCPASPACPCRVWRSWSSWLPQRWLR